MRVLEYTGLDTPAQVKKLTSATHGKPYRARLDD